MPLELAQMLAQTLDREIRNLHSVTDSEAAFKPAPDAWSKKEELGHLIDSAANNHVRFVRAALEPEFMGLSYAQDDWVRIHGYQEMAWLEIIDFWRRYNDFLVKLIERVPADRLGTRCVVGGSAPVTLRFLIEDYVLHMQHHLDHILKREQITAYPGMSVGVSVTR
jgi:hypothetical protein